MNVAKNDIPSNKRTFPALKFSDHRLTSFAGLVVFLRLFQSLNLTEKLNNAVGSLDQKICRKYRHGKVLECLVVHFLLGFSRLRDSDYYKDDPMVKRVLKLKKIPSVATISRSLSDIDKPAVCQMHDLLSREVIDRLHQLKLRRITLDLDGSILSTCRHAEGAAAGFNKKKRGLRSYYPLFITVAQTGQILRFLHRPGNVHDFNGSIDFLKHCVSMIRESMPDIIIEIRMDSAFFCAEMVKTLEELRILYTITVPFERFTKLKKMIEDRKFWWWTKNAKGKEIGYFEKKWKPKSWSRNGRFIFIRTPTKKQQKGPLQLDLFEPVDHENRYKVIFTNKTSLAGNTAAFHEGRGAQEKIFGEAKSQLNMDYIPSKKKYANEAFLLCAVLAHNLGNELQMQADQPQRGTTRQRQSLWIFKEARTLRLKIIQIAGRLTNPQGIETLTIRKNDVIEQEIRNLMLPGV